MRMLVVALFLSLSLGCMSDGDSSRFFEAREILLKKMDENCKPARRLPDFLSSIADLFSSESEGEDDPYDLFIDDLNRAVEAFCSAAGPLE